MVILPSQWQECGQIVYEGIHRNRVIMECDIVFCDVFWSLSSFFRNVSLLLCLFRIHYIGNPIQINIIYVGHQTREHINHN